MFELKCIKKGYIEKSEDHEYLIHRQYSDTLSDSKADLVDFINSNIIKCIYDLEIWIDDLFDSNINTNRVAEAIEMSNLDYWDKDKYLKHIYKIIVMAVMK